MTHLNIRKNYVSQKLCFAKISEKQSTSDLIIMHHLCECTLYRGLHQKTEVAKMVPGNLENIDGARRNPETIFLLKFFEEVHGIN